MSTQENLASSTIAGGQSRTIMSGGTEVTELLPSSASLIALDDCKCPICLDYFIDVVETRCNHRFCRFCLENWLRVSIHRQCPTCRTNVNVGTIHIASHLQDLINATIHPILDEDVIRERRQIRLERQAQVERFATQREQTQALLARITSTSPRSRHIRRGRRLADVDDSTSSETGPNLLSRRIMNWWDDSNAPQASTGGDPSQRRRGEEVYESEVEDLPYGVFRQIRSLNQNFEASPPAQEAPEPPNWNMTSRSNNGMRESQRENRRRTTPTQFDQSYHESLMEEYSYHLRRVNSAHTRIREAYRDFNYHNGRMQEILGEHRSFFATTGRGSENVPGTPDEDPEVTYEDFEDLMGAEMGELLDNSPAAQVVFGRLASGSALGLGSAEVPHNPPNGLRYGMFGRGVDARARGSSTARSSRGSSRRYSHLNNDYDSNRSQRTNVIDMEHEIRSRRNQLSRLSSLIRQCPFNPDTRYPRRRLNSPVDNITNTSAPVSTPIQYLNPVSEADLSGMEEIRGNNHHQHQVMIERLTERTNTTSPSSHSRRMRRRLARTNIFRPGDLIRPRNDNITFNGVPRAGNSFSENLLPSIVALGETGVSNAQNDNSRGTTFANVRSENQARIGNEVGNNTGRNYANIISSPAWAMNGSSDSEEERPTRAESRRSFRRRTSRSPQQVRSQRTLSVPPRSRSHASFRRKVRFQRRQLDNQDTSRMPTMAAAATSASHYNTTLLQRESAEAERRLDELLNAAPDNNNNGEETDRNGNQDTGISLNESGTENDSDILSNSVRGRSSMSNFLKTLCNKFKTR